MGIVGAEEGAARLFVHWRRRLLGCGTPSPFATSISICRIFKESRDVLADGVLRRGWKFSQDNF